MGSKLLKVGKALAIISIASGVVATFSACNMFDKINDKLNKKNYSNSAPVGSGTSPTTSAGETQKKVNNYPDIEEHFLSSSMLNQSVFMNANGYHYTEATFTDYADYFRVGNQSGRYVDLNNISTIYVRYDKNLDPKIIKEIRNVCSYLNQTLKKINPKYNLICTDGDPMFFVADMFVKDTIYFRYDKNKQKEMEKNSTGGITTKGALNSPLIYMNVNLANETVVDGKYITLNNAIMHEILHGMGFDHTPYYNDTMYPSIFKAEKDGIGFYYTENFEKHYINDYLKLSTRELKCLIALYSNVKDLNQRLELLKSLGGETRTSEQIEFERTVSAYLKYSSKYLTTGGPDRIEKGQQVCMIDPTSAYKILFNYGSPGKYLCTNPKGTFIGDFYVYETGGKGVASQVIYLDNFHKYDENKYWGRGEEMKIMIVPNRTTQNNFYSRWQTIGENQTLNLLFKDYTKEYFAEKEAEKQKESEKDKSDSIWGFPGIGTNNNSIINNFEF